MVTDQEKSHYYQIAFVLAIITIFYNILEGFVSVYFGADDETISLLGFGVDSFVEVISGIGIAHLIIRIRNGETQDHDKFEVTALQITGTGFYILAVGLIASVILALIYPHKPDTTLPGIIISVVSIVSMSILIKFKLLTGRKLQSEAIIADANCTKTCLYLSVILLLSSILYEIFQIPFIDLAGSLGIAWFALSEGKESFEKAKNKHCHCKGKCST